MKKHYKFLLLAPLVAGSVGLLALGGWVPTVLAACPDGGAGSDTINCDTAPDTAPDVDGDDLTVSYANPAPFNNGYGQAADTINVSGDVGANDVNGEKAVINVTAAIVLASDTGGNDVITISGNVGGNVNGDNITMNVNSSGANADDYANATAYGGHDTITISGSVGGDVNGDLLSVTATAFQGTVGPAAFGGNDTIIISGSVGGNVNGDNNVAGGSGPGGFTAPLSTGGDDTVTLLGEATVGGTISGGPADTTAFETDTLNFKLDFKNPADLAAFNAAFASLTPADLTIQSSTGTTSINAGGRSYTWTNFEAVINQSVLVITLSGGDEEVTFSVDCGPNPYLYNALMGSYQRPFNMWCELYTGDPNESLYDGLYLDQTPLAP